MAPEANDMLSLHEGIEVDVIVEGRPLNGDRCVKQDLITHGSQVPAQELSCILTLPDTCTVRVSPHDALLGFMQQ